MSFKSEFLSYVKKAKKVANHVVLELAQTFEAPELEAKQQIKLGEQYTDEGDYNAAIENYEEVLKIAQEREDEEDKVCAYGNLGNLYFQTENYERSIHCCVEYLKLTPHDGARKASTARILGASYHNLGQYTEAIPIYEQALELLKDYGSDEEIAETNGHLGIAYKEAGDYKEAVKKLQESIRLSSDNPEYTDFRYQINLSLGCVYTHLNLYKRATECFLCSLQLAKRLKDEEKGAEAYSLLADVEMRRDQPQDAIKYLNKSQKKAQRAGDTAAIAATNQNLGDAYLMNNEPMKAIEYYDGYISDVADKTTNNLELARATIGIGKARAKRNEHELAIEYFLKGLQLLKELRDDGEKEESEAHEFLGDVYSKKSKYEDAKKHYLSALKIATAKDDKELKGRVDISLGFVFCHQQNSSVEEACLYYMDAQEIGESLGDKEIEADAYAGLGRVCQSIHDYDSAIINHEKSLRFAIELDDSRRQQNAHENLGDTYFALKKWLEAVNSYSSSCDIAKHHLHTEAVCRCQTNMGKAYYEMKDYYNAEVYLRCCLDINTPINDDVELYKMVAACYSKTDQPQSALEFYEKYLEAAGSKMSNTDEVATVCLEAGKLHENYGDCDRAIQLYEQYLNFPGDSKLKQEVLERLGDVYYRKALYDKACEYYEKICDRQHVTERGKRCLVYYKIGKVFFSQKKFLEAIQHYFEAIDYVEDEAMHADICEDLGVALFMNKNYENAIKYHSISLDFAKNILKDDKQRQRAYENRGDAHRARNEWSQAISDYEQSCEVATKLDDKTGIQARCEGKMGFTYYEAKEYHKAIKLLEKVGQDAQAEEIYLVLGRAYAKVSQYEKAEEYLRKDLRNTQDLPDIQKRQARVYGYIGRVCVKTGKFEDATQCHQKALDIVLLSNDKAEEAEVYCNLGCAYLANLQYAEAMENQKQFLQLANYLDDKSLQARAHKKIGNIYYANGLHECAIESYEASLKVIKSVDTHFPNDSRKQSTAVRVLGKLGCSQRGVGQLEKAISNHKSQFEKAVNLKDTVRAFENLINDYELNGDYEEALHLQEKYFKEAKKLGGDAHGKACVNIARVHLAKGEYREAIRKVQTAEKLDNAAVKARAYGVMGCAYTGLGLYEKAENMHRKQMHVMNPNDKSENAQAEGNIGIAYVGKSDYKNAIASFQRQKKFVQEIQSKREDGRMNENFGYYYAAIGEFEEAIPYYDKSLKIAEEVGDKAAIARTKSFMGTTFTEMGQYQNALKCHEEEIEIAEKLKNKVREGQALGNLGNVYTNLCKYHKAIELHKKSLRIAEEHDVQADQRRANANLGNAFIASGQLREALKFLNEALKIARLLGHRAAEGRIHENIAKAYYFSGKFDKAVQKSEESLLMPWTSATKPVRDELSEHWGMLTWNLGKVSKQVLNFVNI